MTTSSSRAATPPRRTFRRGLVALLAAPLLALVAAAPVAVAHDDEPHVDPFGQDRNSLSGTIDEVCGPGPSHDAAAARPGRVALIEYLREAFPDVQGFAGFSCREIHNPRGSCAGRAAPPSSDCWSTHAAGRAIDVMTGGAGDQDGYPVGGEIGDRVVNHLLERVHGIDNYRARIMGVQQLLWNGACWNSSSDGDRGITDISELDDDCVDLHDNHVHITLSEAAAEGLTSFFTGEVLDPDDLDARIVEDTLPAEPDTFRDQALVLYDATDGSLLVRGLDDEGVAAEVDATNQMSKGWTSVATPDVLGNGDDEVFAYRASDGRHVIRELRGDGSLGSTVGSGTELEPGHTIVATPDVDGDGDDELLLYRADDGAWVLHELLDGGALGPALQPRDAIVDVFFSAAATPDLDGDGDDELVLYRRFDGHHVVMDFGVAGDAEAGDDEAGDAEDELDEAEGDPSPEDVAEADAPGPFDEDGDGVVDTEMVLEAVTSFGAGFVVSGDDEDETTTEDDEVDATDTDLTGDLEDDSLPIGALGVSLSPGFTALGSPDVDHDGIDELVFYREADGCLAIRRVGGTDAESTDQPDVADESSTSPDDVAACLVAPEADGEADGEAAAAELDADDQELPAVRWLVESWDTVDAGWTSGASAAFGDEQLVEPS